jgi:hypothetical protein
MSTVESQRSHNRSRRHMFLQLAIGACALLAIPAAVDCDHWGAPTGSSSVQLARSAQRIEAGERRTKITESDADVDTFAPIKHGSGYDKGTKNSSGGYNPKTIQRFWRSYHGSRPAPKSKPLEHEH